MIDLFLFFILLMPMEMKNCGRRLFHFDLRLHLNADKSLKFKYYSLQSGFIH